MDHFSHLFGVKIVLTFEKTEINKNEAGNFPFKKNLMNSKSKLHLENILQ